MNTSFIVPAEWRDFFLNEFAARVPKNKLSEIEPGFFQSSAPVSVQVTTCLFQADGFEILQVESIQKGAAILADWISARADFGSWNLVSGVHASSLKVPAQSQRSRLIETAALEIIRKKMPEAWSRHVVKNASRIVCTFVLASGNLAVCACLATLNECSQLAGARAVLKPNQEPPSRAFLKLQEGFQRFNFIPSGKMSAVDLGASPGGWTWELARHGVQVQSIDRAPLDPKVMAFKNVTAAIGDAMKFQPKSAVDVMVCDMIAFPEQSLKLLENWLTQNWCATFFITFKFKREPDWKWLDQAARSLTPLCSRLMMRKLEANKNEIMIMGTARIN